MYCKECGQPWCCFHNKDLWPDFFQGISRENVYKHMLAPAKLEQKCKLCRNPALDHKKVNRYIYIYTYIHNSSYPRSSLLNRLNGLPLMVIISEYQ